MLKEGNLGIDAIYSEPVTDTISRWKRLVDMNQHFGKPFSMFWVSGPDDKTAIAVDLVAKQLGINRASAIEFEIDSAEWNLSNRLVQLADKVKSTDGDRVLILASGYERVLANTTDSYRLSRAGHDWDQVVLEDPKRTRWGKLYRDIDKHVIIVTMIGFSMGGEAYDKAVVSAVGSDFKNGILELSRD